MWFLFALLTTLSWAGADVFYKKGAALQDRFSHIKTVIMVGLVMGIHGFLYMLITLTPFSPRYLVLYAPVSILYILSMAIGYFGLRYIELSIASPVENSSGAVTAILIYLFFPHSLSPLDVTGIALITFGIVALAALDTERNGNAALPHAAQKKYRIGVAAITFPTLYCMIDGLGTFADAIYLDELSLIGESEALLAYEFTFFICAVAALIFLKHKKEPFVLSDERDRGAAAIFETAGQFFYVFAMSRNAIIAAPLIASYSAFSVLLSRLFLKETLTKNQYAVVAAVVAGIALLAISEAAA